MTKLLAIGLVLFGLATPVRQCVPPAPQGEHKVYVPYYSQEMYYWCVPACIKMWANYCGDYYTQSQIWNWARSWYSGEVIPGVGFTSLRSVTRTATNFVGRPVSEFRYVGKAGRRQAVSDQEAGLDSWSPRTTLVPMGESHVVLFTGASRQQLPPDDRPSADYVLIHDPGLIAYRNIGLNEWMNWLIVTPETLQWLPNGGDTYNVFFPEQYHGGNALLGAFEAEGGTYPGDPDAPPLSGPGRWKDDGAGGCYWDPNDSGPDQCTPGGGVSLSSANLTAAPQHPLARTRGFGRAALGAFLASLQGAAAAPVALPTGRHVFRSARRSLSPAGLPVAAAPSGSRQSLREATAPAKRGQVKEAPGRGYLPRPGGTSTLDVLANLKAGMERMKITAQPDWKALYEDFGRWETFRLARVVAVKSLALNHPDYFIVQVNDAQNRRYALFCVSAEGWLLEWVKTVGTRMPEILGAPDVDRILTRHGISVESSGRDQVFASNSLLGGWSPLTPLARVVRGSRTYYLHGNGNLYEEAAPEEEDTDGYMYKLGSKVRLKQVR